MKRTLRILGIAFACTTIALGARTVRAAGYENAPQLSTPSSALERPDLVGAAHLLVSETVLPHARYSLGIDFQIDPQLRGDLSTMHRKPALSPWEQALITQTILRTFADSRLFHPVIPLSDFDRLDAPVDYILTGRLVNAEALKTSQRVGLDLEVEVGTPAGDVVWKSPRLHVDAQRGPASLITPACAVAISGTIFNTVGGAFGTCLIPVPERPVAEHTAQPVEVALPR